MFLPNYNVSLAETIIPAVDLSEQISTAGMEASGTGNMKMALNGALTVGTLDGANVELRDLVGDDNIFIFGLTAAEVEASRAKGIDSSARIAASPVLREALDEIASGVFSPDEPRPLPRAGRYPDASRLFHGLRRLRRLLGGADADRRRCGATAKRWWRSSIINTANIGWFSSDRTIAEYARRDLERAVRARLSGAAMGKRGEGLEAQAWRAPKADIDAIAAARQPRSLRRPRARIRPRRAGSIRAFVARRDLACAR